MEEGAWPAKEPKEDSAPPMEWGMLYLSYGSFLISPSMESMV